VLFILVLEITVFVVAVIRIIRAIAVTVAAVTVITVTVVVFAVVVVLEIAAVIVVVILFETGPRGIKMYFEATAFKLHGAVCDHGQLIAHHISCTASLCQLL